MLILNLCFCLVVSGLFAGMNSFRTCVDEVMIQNRLLPVVGKDLAKLVTGFCQKGCLVRKLKFEYGHGLGSWHSLDLERQVRLGLQDVKVFGETKMVSFGVQLLRSGVYTLEFFGEFAVFDLGQVVRGPVRVAVCSENNGSMLCGSLFDRVGVFDSVTVDTLELGDARRENSVGLRFKGGGRFECCFLFGKRTWPSSTVCLKLECLVYKEVEEEKVGEKRFVASLDCARNVFKENCKDLEYSPCKKRKY